MNFPEAMEHILNGGRCTRDAWGSEAIFVHQDAIGNVSMTQPSGPPAAPPQTTVWSAAQDDMRATDWRVVEG